MTTYGLVRQISWTPAAAILLAALVVVCSACPAAADSGPSWAQNQGALQPGAPNAGEVATRNAAIPPGPIKPPGPEVPEAIRGLSGRWAGWMCAKGACAASLEVTSLSATGGKLKHVISSYDYYDAFPLDMDASLVNGNELHGKWRDIWIKVRLRPDGNVDILRWWSNNPKWTRWGVLSRIP